MKNIENHFRLKLNFKNKYLLLLIGPLVYLIISLFDLSFLDAKFIDACQILFSTTKKVTEVVTVTIDPESLTSLGRPLTFENIKKINETLLAYTPEKIVYMISPKELVENQTERTLIKNYLKKN